MCTNVYCLGVIASAAAVAAVAALLLLLLLIAYCRCTFISYSRALFKNPCYVCAILQKKQHTSYIHSSVSGRDTCDVDSFQSCIKLSSMRTAFVCICVFPYER